MRVKNPHFLERGSTIMFVTNLTKNIVGIDGIINLAPEEKDRYIDENYKDLQARCESLKNHGYISIDIGAGLEKNGLPMTELKAENAAIEPPKVEEPVATETDGSVDSEDSTEEETSEDGTKAPKKRTRKATTAE